MRICVLLICTILFFVSCGKKNRGDPTKAIVSNTRSDTSANVSANVRADVNDKKIIPILREQLGRGPTSAELISYRELYIINPRHFKYYVMNYSIAIARFKELFSDLFDRQPSIDEISLHLADARWLSTPDKIAAVMVEVKKRFLFMPVIPILTHLLLKPSQNKNIVVPILMNRGIL